MDPRSSFRKWTPNRLPRARGDGPHPERLGLPRMMAPPRSRGWTRHRAPRWRGVSGSPALAGMDPSLWSAMRFSTRLPRARGDGPFDTSTSVRTYSAPPRSRGWTASSRRLPSSISGSPALAGMDPFRSLMLLKKLRLPRARGDGPRVGQLVGDHPRAPPRSRGWTPDPRSTDRSGAGSPALAGMDPVFRGLVAVPDRLPRARGDGPGFRGRCTGQSRAPPRSRGWTLS